MQKLRNTYDGASIAVIGSAPSATQYSGLEDIAIGVNGAGQLLSPTDLFFSNDERAYNRSWFLNLDSRVHCILRAQAAIYSEKLYPDERTRLHYQRSYESYMDTNPPSLKVIDSGFRFVLAGDPIVDKLFSTLPDPAPPHTVLRRVATDEPISREQKCLNAGGTSACGAVQLAHILGASEIHLYGVEFSNDASTYTRYDGNNYFYKPQPDERGMTHPSQREYFDNVIRRIIKAQ